MQSRIVLFIRPYTLDRADSINYADQTTAHHKQYTIKFECLDYPIYFVTTLCSSYKSHSLKSNAALAFKAASAAACKVLQDASPMPISKSEPNYTQIRYAKHDTGE